MSRLPLPKSRFGSSDLGLIFHVPASESPPARQELEAFWCDEGGAPFEEELALPQDFLWGAVAPFPREGDDTGGDRLDQDDVYGLLLTAPRQESPAETVEYQLNLVASLASCASRPREAFHRQVQRLAALRRRLLDRGYSVDAWIDYSREQITPAAHLMALADNPAVPAVADACGTHLFVRTVRPHASWIHTHGLKRFGIPELEVFGLQLRQAETVEQLFAAVAEQWIAHGVPEPYAPFSMTLPPLDLVWAPSDELEPQLLPADRDAGSDHRPHQPDDDRAVLLPANITRDRVTRDWAYGMRSWLRQMQRETMAVCVSDFETDRQAIVALHRLPIFLELARAFVGNAGWRFLVKLAYEREHIWYEIHDVIGPDMVRARLIVRPIFTQGLSDEPIDVNLRERLSGWIIEPGGGRIVGPDSVAHIERLKERLHRKQAGKKR